MDFNSFLTKPPKISQLSRRACCARPAAALALWDCNRCWPTWRAPNADPLAPKSPMFPARAKRVIFLFMHGGPSSIDTFDPKPYLTANNGKPLPIKQPLTFAAGHTGGLMKSPWKFKNSGQMRSPDQRSVSPHSRMR